MERITIRVEQADVYEEVAKVTDYTGAKIVSAEDLPRDLLMTDEDFETFDRFWDETATAANESLKELLVRGDTIHADDTGDKVCYVAEFEVSRAFNKELVRSVESALRSFFIASIIAQWFKFVNKEESKDYFVQAGDVMETAERLLYSRKRPKRPCT